MATALVVDDSPIDQRLAGAILEDRCSLTVQYARNGREALSLIGREQPDLVLTDMQMPEMGGLELVEAIRKSYGHIPVILMTAHGSEDVAAEALRKGAASYVPKRYLSRDLPDTVDEVLLAKGGLHELQLAFECLQVSDYNFVLDNNSKRVTALIGFLRQELERYQLCDETEVMRVGIALCEAMNNAINHGNLEVDSSLREEDINAFEEMLDIRRTQEPYCRRRVYVSARFNRDEVVYNIRDEGKGFDPSKLPDPTDVENIAKPSGRGILLIRSFMDTVFHNDTGNEITMIKRRGDLHDD